MRDPYMVLRRVETNRWTIMHEGTIESVYLWLKKHFGPGEPSYDVQTPNAGMQPEREFIQEFEAARNLNGSSEYKIYSRNTGRGFPGYQGSKDEVIAWLRDRDLVIAVNLDVERTEDRTFWRGDDFLESFGKEQKPPTEDRIRQIVREEMKALMQTMQCRCGVEKEV